MMWRAQEGAICGRSTFSVAWARAEAIVVVDTFPKIG